MTCHVLCTVQNTKVPAAVEATATQQGQQARQAALLLLSHAKSRRLGRNKLFSGGKSSGVWLEALSGWLEAPGKLRLGAGGMDRFWHTLYGKYVCGECVVWRVSKVNSNMTHVI